MKVMVCSPSSDTNFFNINTGVLKGDILASYMFIICLKYVLQISIDQIKKSFILKKIFSLVLIHQEPILVFVYL